MVTFQTREVTNFPVYETIDTIAWYMANSTVMESKLLTKLSPKSGPIPAGGQLGMVPNFGRRYVFRLFHFAIFDVFICPWAGVMDCDIAAVPGPKVNHIFHASLSFAASFLST